MVRKSRFGVFGQLYIALIVLFGVLGLGVFGFYFIEDYSLMESFYMTVITVSTVGFKEVRELSAYGQLFTSILIISSFGTFAFGVSVVTRAVLTGELASYYKIYQLENRIGKLNNHVIICGFGRNGRRAAVKLKAYHQDFVVIESDRQIIEEHLIDKDINFIEGDATSDEDLTRAGALRAKSLISTLSKDADNLYVVISARSLNPKINIISRAAHESAEKKLKVVGANHVVMPEGVGGAHMATLVMSPNIVEFLEFLSVEGSSAINLEEIEVSQITDTIESIQIKDLALRQKTGCSIIGLKNPSGEYVINPNPDIKIDQHSRLFVLGKPEEIELLYKLLNT